MKQIVRTGGGGGRGRWRTPTEEEVEVVEILLTLPKLCAKSEFIRRYSFNWGRKKKRSVLDSKSESSPSTKPPIDEGVTENVTAVEADKSPSTPLCFLPSGSGSDGADNRKPPSAAVRKVLKRKATDDLMEVISKVQQEGVILKKKVEAMETRRQELTSENLELNLELKARGQKINYPRTMEDLNIWWNNSMRVIDQQRCHQQITMFTPAPPHYYHQQQLVVDPNNGKPVALSCSSNSNSGGRFGMFNHIDPRVMASSQPLDQSKYLMMDNDLRARAAAAAARKRRKLRMKKEVDIEEDVNDTSVKIHGETSYDFMASSQPLDQSQYLVNDFMAASQPLDQSKYLVMDDDDLRFRSEAAAARKRRILRMKESKNSVLAMKLSGASACR